MVVTVNGQPEDRDPEQLLQCIYRLSKSLTESAAECKGAGKRDVECTAASAPSVFARPLRLFDFSLLTRIED